jgi:hypothetical protein
MAKEGIFTLSLRIAGGECRDFYPYELRLEEGFSKIYKASLTVLTSRVHTREELSALLDHGVTLSVSQRLGSANVRTRYVHGIITGFTVNGIFFSGTRDCYSYGLTIEHELARLRFTRFSAPYYNKTPVNIIEEILAKYGIQGNFPGEYVDRNRYGKNLMFDQHGVSDLAFIEELLTMYGLSYTFVHTTAPSGALGTADLCFFDGYRFPRPVCDYSDKRKTGDVAQFDFLSSDEARNIWKMEVWRMESVIGTDGLELTVPYPNANYGSRDWRQGKAAKGERYWNYSWMFHGYDRLADNGEIDADIKLILEAYNCSFGLARKKWTGKADNVLLMPGTVFDLRHFLGIKDKAVISAALTAATLHVRRVWPDNLAPPPQDADTDERLEVEFSAINWGNGSGKRYTKGVL